MSRKKILIAEDDVLISEELKFILIEFGYDVVGIAEDFAAAKDIIDRTPLDFAILDINLHGKEEGFSIASYLEKSSSIPFIFLTSYSDSGTLEKAAKYQSNYYITKPFRKEQVFATLKMAFSRNINKSHYILIKQGGKSQKISTTDILWIRADGVYIELRTKQKRILLRTSLKSFLEEHKVSSFVRIHRSFAVNIQHVESISNSFVFIADEQFPISRSKKNDVEFAFNNYKNQ